MRLYIGFVRRSRIQTHRAIEEACTYETFRFSMLLKSLLEDVNKRILSKKNKQQQIMVTENAWELNFMGKMVLIIRLQNKQIAGRVLHTLCKT